MHNRRVDNRKKDFLTPVYQIVVSRKSIIVPNTGLPSDKPKLLRCKLSLFLLESSDTSTQQTKNWYKK
ncbi:hypothetical protein SAMN05216167_102143 [Spirosoma endophyticum]|uniref:Uncharacterized protein n=1 Tax=Spirosoma endophyticum TaxID=662367 RepID=A0A1I1L5K5_9BACT|nr:hypothetical protein SAMN05216167_102143 [Spirosoma endophyticum]